MAETVFASEQVEELAFIDAAADFAFGYAIIAEFPNYFFVGDGPRNGSNGKGKDE
jgi:hypothetical protein